MKDNDFDVKVLKVMVRSVFVWILLFLRVFVIKKDLDWILCGNYNLV